MPTGSTFHIDTQSSMQLKLISIYSFFLSIVSIVPNPKLLVQSAVQTFCHLSSKEVYYCLSFFLPRFKVSLLFHS
jgi:hypothetical protein